MVEPKKAAACIIMDADGRILMVRRSPELRFMPGHHAFPGGRVNDTESTEFVVGADGPALARSVKAAAREAFEETGLLLTEGHNPGAEALRNARIDMLKNNVEFDKILSAFGSHINAANYETVAHWITPSGPIRFDTLYFLVQHRGPQTPELIPGELVGLDWLHPHEARQRWHKGEIHVSTPVACTLQPLAARPYPECVPLVRRLTLDTPGHPNRFELRRGIHLIPVKTKTILPATHTNCLLIGEEEYLLIDPGSDLPGELESMCDQIDQLSDMGAKMRAIVVTHSHPDHVEGVSYVRDRYDVPVWAHGATAERVDFDVDRRVDEGDVIDLPGDPGWRVRVMHTPGHDLGHLCLYEETTRTLVAADMVANPGTIVVSEQYGGNMDQFIASLERLMAMEEPRLIIPSHGIPVGRSEEIFRKHRDHRLWRENKIREAYESGHTEFKALLAAAYDDAKPEAMPLAEHALRAHLTRLGLKPEE